MRIYHNVPALHAYNALNVTNNSLQKSIRNLSSGLRINSAADDAAGLAISEKMRAQVSGLNMAVRNSQDGISMLQTAEGALGESHSILQRMRELAVQAANDTLTRQDRQYIQLEVDQLKGELSRISSGTQFNKKKLLDGSSAGLWSSSDLATKAYIRGSLRQTDQFGQKAAFEGNFKISVSAEPGQAEAQKTDIFVIKHKNVAMGVNINEQPGGRKIDWTKSTHCNFVAADSAQTAPVGMANGSYEVVYVDDIERTAGYVQQVAKTNAEGGNITIQDNTLSNGFSGMTTLNGLLTFEVTGKTADTVTFTVSGSTSAKADLGASTAVSGTLTLNIDGSAVAADYGAITSGANLRYSLGSTDLSKYKIGDKLTYNYVPTVAATTDALMQVKGTTEDGSFATHTFVGTKLSSWENNDNMKFNLAYVDKDNKLQNGSINVMLGAAAGTLTNRPASGATLATFAKTQNTGENWNIRSQGNWVASVKDHLDPDMPAGAVTVSKVNNAADIDGAGVAIANSNSANATITLAAPTTPANVLRNAIVTYTVTGVNTTTNTVTASFVSKVTALDGTVSEYKGIQTISDASTLATGTGANGIGIADTSESLDFQILPDEAATFNLGDQFVWGYNAHVAANSDNVAVFSVTGGSAIYNMALNESDVSNKTVNFDTPRVKDGKLTDSSVSVKFHDVSSWLATDTITNLYSSTGIEGSLVSGPAMGSLRLDNLPAGNYSVTAKNIARSVPDSYVVETGRYGNVGSIDASVNWKLDTNSSVLLEVVSVDEAGKSVTFKGTSHILRMDGTVDTKVNNNIVLTEANLEGTDMSTLGFAADSFRLKLLSNQTSLFSVGSKLVYNTSVGKNQDSADMVIQLDGVQNSNWDDRWGNPGNGVASSSFSYGLKSESIGGKDLHFRNFYLNSANGKVYESDIILAMKDKVTAPVDDVSIASFEAAYVGQVAKHDVNLRDLRKFWDSQGKFMLTDPQTITISQGDGKNTSITLYSTDTLDSVRSKLNSAIANDLGQARFAVSEANKFVSFIEEGKDYPGTLESVPGTFIIRSMVAGNSGKLSFAGDEDLINALSLNVVQEAKENSFLASIYDAHNGITIASSVKVTGNQMVGVIHPNVDVEFDPMANIKVTWNENTRAFDLVKESSLYETVLHLVDNSTIFQVGANEGEDMSIDIGDMSADALGVTRVIVTDRDSAARAISILDSAIGRVSAQRAKIGAFQNSLEHTITNLTATSTNLTAAESRIRDVDMALEMLNFTRLQILSQSGTSMLAQANQLPQSIMKLLQ